MKLEVNSMAPDFMAEDQDGVVHKLADYAGKYLLLYFYPEDDTPGCTTEACKLRDNFGELKKYAEIIGVSSNTSASHKKFAEKYGLPFTLLADPSKQIIGAYGADGLILKKRVSFLINPEGKVVKIYDKVVPAEHADQILSDLKSGAF